MSGGVWTALQTIVSLVVVLALVFTASRLLGRASGHDKDGVLDVLARQALGRTSSVAVVRVADRAYVLGVTDTHITLLDEADLAAMTEVIAATRPAARHPRVRAGIAALGAGSAGAGSADTTSPGSAALRGSIFSAAAWRQGIEAVRDRTARP